MPPRGRRGRRPVAEESSDDEPDVPTQPTNQVDDDDDGEPAAATNSIDSPNPTASASNPAGIQPADDNTLRVLLSTDNHLGYLERDPIRGLDSFAAFEEVLSLARSQKADLVLLSGDVFHDNKPSRRTLHKTMEILRRYCMGGESVGFQIDQVDNVQVSPVLLQKGGTKVALYGMGSMRDERLNRMWQGKKVKFLRPEEDDNRRRRGGEEDEEEDNGGSGWFNIFTLHQNRDLGRGSKNCVHESMIPEWMDLVVWGHEHECLITPQESLVGTFRISQPGSSVATSLTQGEGRQKHVGILDIRGQQFRLKSIPLGSVRGFAIGDVSLTELAEGGTVLDIEDPKLEERMGDVLAAEVENLIKRAREEAEQHRQDAANHAKEALTLEDEFDPDKRQRNYTLQSPEQVLVRLKVEHSGFTTLNNQRFGSRFVGEVANPSDILLFHRRRQAENTTAKGAATKKKRAAAGMYDPTEPEELEEVNVEDLVNENLFNMDKKLELLTEREMGEALDDFVSKEQKQAIGDMAAIILRKSQKTLTSRGKEGGRGQYRG
eukprot:g14358.t1 g14358   contig9:1664367-1666563(-)